MLLVFFCQKQSDCPKGFENSGFIFGSGEQVLGLLTTLSHEFSNCCWQIKQNSFWLIKKLVQIGKLGLVSGLGIRETMRWAAYNVIFFGFSWPFLAFFRHETWWTKWFERMWSWCLFDVSHFGEWQKFLVNMQPQLFNWLSSVRKYFWGSCSCYLEFSLLKKSLIFLKKSPLKARTGDLLLKYKVYTRLWGLINQ